MAGVRGLFPVAAIFSGLLVGVCCQGRTHRAVLDSRVTFLVEEWGAPWAPYLRVKADHKGSLELWYREEASEAPKGPHVLHISPEQERELFLALSSFFCESREVIEEPPADWRRLRITFEMPDRRIELTLKGNPSKKQLAAIKSLNRLLPKPFRFEETVFFPPEPYP